MPTIYPKCSPGEVVGLLVLLKDHKGSEDVARLADDLDLEIDEIFPSTEFAEALGLIRINDGRATMTPVGEKILAASIRERKSLLREQLRRTTLFRTLVQALESKPDRQLTEDELNSLVEFTTAPADEYVQNIINWGRFVELFRYDPDRRLILPSKARPATRAPPGARPPPGPGSPAETPVPRTAEAAADPPARSRASSLAPLLPPVRSPRA